MSALLKQTTFESLEGHFESLYHGIANYEERSPKEMHVYNGCDIKLYTNKAEVFIENDWFTVVPERNKVLFQIGTNKGIKRKIFFKNETTEITKFLKSHLDINMVEFVLSKGKFTV